MYWIVSAALCLWAIAYAGLVYASFTSTSPETLQDLVANGVIKQAYADYILAIPLWVRGVSVALAGLRLIGGLGLLLRQGWSAVAYALALILTLIIMYRGFFIADVASVIRPSQIGVEIAFIVISVFAVWFSFTNARK